MEDTVIKTPEMQVPETTLVHFGNPQLVTADTKMDLISSKFKDTRGFLSKNDKGLNQLRRKQRSVDSDKDRSLSCSVVASVRSDQDILNLIAPPRVWFHNRKRWRQVVSSVPATRMDILELKKKMENLIKVRAARKTGFCEIRRSIYSQVFDEIIRHITVNCAERGLMLINARDDIRYTMKHFEKVYFSAVAYGIRKKLLTLELEDKLRHEIQSLKAEVEYEQQMYDEIIPHYKKFADQYVKTSEDSEKEYLEEYEKLLKRKNGLKTLVEQSVGLKKAQPKSQGKENKPKLMDKLANLQQSS